MRNCQQSRRAWLRLFALEDRTVPASLVWVGDVSGLWGANSGGNTNWFNQTTLTDNVLPHDGDVLQFPAASSNHTQSNNITGLGLSSITLLDTDFVIGGSAAISVGTITDGNSGGANVLNLPISGAVTVAVNAASARLTLGGVISGSGTLTKNGAGILRLDGASVNSYTGLTTVNAGTLELNKSGGTQVAVPGNLTINSGGTVRFATFFGNEIADTSTVTVNAGGTLDFNNLGDAFSALTVNGGLVTIGTGLCFPGTVTMTGGSITSTGSGKLQLSGNLTTNATSSTATISGGLDLNGATRTVTVNDGIAAIDLDIPASIFSTVSAGLTKAGAGILQLSGSVANTYTGLTTLSAGTLFLGKTGGALAGDLTINGGAAIELAISQIADTSIVTVNTGGTFSLNGQADTISALNVNGSSVSIGVGTLTAGPVTLNGGSITSTGAGALHLTGDVATIASSATASITGSLNLGGSTRTFTVPEGSAITDLAIPAAISGSGVVGLTKVGDGLMDLQGTAANTYAGLTTVSAGTLEMTKTVGALAVSGFLTIDGGIVREMDTNQINDSSVVTINPTATFDLNGFVDTVGPVSVSGSGSVTIGTGILTAGAVTMTGGSIASTGAGKLVLLGDVTVNLSPGSGFISGALDLNGSTRTFNVADGASAIDLEIAAVIAGAGGAGLTKTQSGIMEIASTAANTYTGPTTVSAGTLFLTNGGNLAVPGNLTITTGGTVREIVADQIANTATVTVNAGGTLDLNGLADTIGPLTVAGSSVTIGTGTLTVTSVSMTGGSIASTGAGKLVLHGNVTTSAATSNATIFGNLNLGGAIRTFDVAEGAAAIDLDIVAAISGMGSEGLTKAGAGAMRLEGSAPNTYTGTTTVNAGTLSVSKSGGVLAVPGNLSINGGTASEFLLGNQIADTSTVTVNSGSTFDLSGLSDAIGPLTVGGGSVTIGAGTLTATLVTMTAGSIASTGAGKLVPIAVTTNIASVPATISGSVDLGGLTRVFTVPEGAADPDLDISAAISNGSVFKDGVGKLRFSETQSNTFALTTVSAGTLALAAASEALAVPGDLTINTGAARELAGNQIADTSTVTVNSGSTFDLNGQTDTVGTLTVTGGTLTTGGATAGRLTAGNTSFNSAATVAMKLVDAAISDRLTVNGTVAVGGALQLNLSLPVAIGTAITLIDNDGADPVTGAFANLSQGVTFLAGSQLFSISYSGGTGNDVVVTRTGGPTVLSTRVNDGSAQRSQVTSLTVTFSAVVNFAGSFLSAFTLTRNGGGAVTISSGSSGVVNGVTVVILTTFTGAETEFGSLRDGRYTLTALANQITQAGFALDGNGDGTAGDNFTFGEAQGLFRFYGDINGDRHVDIADFGLFSSTFNLSTGQTGFIAAFDFNNDGHIDIADFGQFSIRLFTLLP